MKLILDEGSTRYVKKYVNYRWREKVDNSGKSYFDYLPFGKYPYDGGIIGTVINTGDKYCASILEGNRYDYTEFEEYTRCFFDLQSAKSYIEKWFRENM